MTTTEQNWKRCQLRREIGWRWLDCKYFSLSFLPKSARMGVGGEWQKWKWNLMALWNQKFISGPAYKKLLGYRNRSGTEEQRKAEPYRNGGLQGSPGLGQCLGKLQKVLWGGSPWHSWIIWPCPHLGRAASGGSNCQANALNAGIGLRETHGTLMSYRPPTGWRALGTGRGLLTLPTWPCVFQGHPHSQQGADRMSDPKWTGIPSDKDG